MVDKQSSEWKTWNQFDSSLPVVPLMGISCTVLQVKTCNFPVRRHQNLTILTSWINLGSPFSLQVTRNGQQTFLHFFLDETKNPQRFRWTFFFFFFFLEAVRVYLLDKATVWHKSSFSTLLLHSVNSSHSTLDTKFFTHCCCFTLENNQLHHSSFCCQFCWLFVQENVFVVSKIFLRWKTKLWECDDTLWESFSSLDALDFLGMAPFKTMVFGVNSTFSHSGTFPSWFWGITVIILAGLAPSVSATPKPASLQTGWACVALGPLPCSDLSPDSSFPWFPDSGIGETYFALMTF